MKEDQLKIQSLQKQVQKLQGELKVQQQLELQIKELQESIKTTQEENNELKYQIQNLNQTAVGIEALFESNIQEFELSLQEYRQSRIKIDLEQLQALKNFEKTVEQQCVDWDKQLKSYQIPLQASNLKLNLTDQINSQLQQDFYCLPPTDRPGNYIQKNYQNFKVSSRSQTPHLYEGENCHQSSPSLVSNDYEISHPSVFNQEGSQQIVSQNQEEVQHQIKEVIQEETCTQQDNSSYVERHDHSNSYATNQNLSSHQTDESEIHNQVQNASYLQNESNSCCEQYSNSQYQNNSPKQLIEEIQKALRVIKKLGLLEMKNQPVLTQICEIMNDKEQTGQLELVMQLINLNRKIPEQKIHSQRDPSPKKNLISPSNQRKPPTPTGRNSAHNLQLSQLSQLIHFAQQNPLQQQQLWDLICTTPKSEMKTNQDSFEKTVHSSQCMQKQDVNLSDILDNSDNGDQSLLPVSESNSLIEIVEEINNNQEM